MHSIDLLLALPERDSGVYGLIHATVISPLGSEAFQVGLPADLTGLFDRWLRNYIAYHDTSSPVVAATGVTTEAVSTLANRLVAKLDAWLRQPEWNPLQRQLLALPELPLRLRITPAGSVLARWPWEALPLQRPIWRLAPTRPAPAPVMERPARRPRFLVLQGQAAEGDNTAEQALDFGHELGLLRRLNRQGGVDLIIQTAERSSRGVLSARLNDPLGWEGVLFLGHSQADGHSGRLRLADGTWLSGSDLARELAQSAGGCPAFVVLNSCSSLEVAEACIAAGVEWVIAFRERVPDRAASFALRTLLGELQAHGDLAKGVAQTRQALNHPPQSGTDSEECAGCHLLLSAICADTAGPLCLPLTRSRQFWSRLRRGTGAQVLVAAVAIMLGLGLDLDPANPLSTWLLNGRLDVQRVWRQVTGNLGPRGAPLPLLLLRNNQLKSDLGVEPFADRLSSKALNEVLRRAPNPDVPVVALDFILDDPKPDPAALAQTIRRQQPRRVFAGFPPGASAVEGAGATKPLKLLEDSGLEVHSISVGTSSERGANDLQVTPLQLSQTSLGPDTFAAVLAQSMDRRLSRPSLPLHAVVDWSIDWRPLLAFQRPDGLRDLRAPALLVGSDGSQTVEPRDRDLFETPRALAGALDGANDQEIGEWATIQVKLPGAVLQAVLAQSMVLGHWLTPWATGPSTALAAGLGVLGAAAIPSRRRRAMAWVVVSAIAIPLALQAAVTTKAMVPLTLPLLACGATALAGVSRSPFRGKRRELRGRVWAASGAADHPG
jgi:hypothetical protein